VIVISTLGAPERRRLQRRKRKAEPEPEPVPVSTTRATVVEVGSPFATDREAVAWLGDAGDADLDAGLFVLNRALHVFRLVTADPYVNPVGRHGALVARLGYGAGEQVSEGQWTDAVELSTDAGRQNRAKVLTPQAHLAAVLNGREQRMACEELILRARLDFDSRRDREAALQMLIAVDAVIAEISVDPTGPRLQQRLDEISSLRDAVAEAGQQALAGPLEPDARAVVEAALRRTEAILRARAVVNAR
jgi:hypothetical protein